MMEILSFMGRKQTHMSKLKRDKSNPFYIDGHRAMVSLGPLTDHTYCPYRCAFCYVQDEFGSYVNLGLIEIIDFLVKNRDRYNIIYISGDTDSFAPPRAQQGIKLLGDIVKAVNCDLTFSTRSIFSDSEYEQLSEIIKEHQKSGYKFIAGSSITRYSASTTYLEPYPIPSPDERIQHIKKMKQLGAITMLGLRPFLPIVNMNDYAIILDKLHPDLDIALGECFFFIRGGNIQRRVFPDGISADVEKNIVRNQVMDFDDNDFLWDIWNSTEYEKFVADHCAKLGIIFAMHSKEALEAYDKLCNKK